MKTIESKNLVMVSGGEHQGATSWADDVAWIGKKDYTGTPYEGMGLPIFPVQIWDPATEKYYDGIMPGAKAFEMTHRLCG